jgi:uncharacterized RDD family membrane protein YckC
MTPTTNEPNLLVDLEQELNLEPASMGQRFANFIVDYIVAIIIYVGITIMMLFFSASDGSELEEEGFGSIFISLFSFVAVYTLTEFLGKGKTLGKLITRTRAVRNDGGLLTFKDALLRSLIRLVPFEVFSGFGTYTWHDQWTNTMVRKD